MTPQEITRRQIERLESRIAWLTSELRRAEGQRDSLLREMLDHEGASDKRFVAAR